MFCRFDCALSASRCVILSAVTVEQQSQNLFLSTVASCRLPATCGVLVGGCRLSAIQISAVLALLAVFMNFVEFGHEARFVLSAVLSGRLSVW